MVIEELIYALLNNDHHESLLLYRQRLEEMLTVMPSENHYGDNTFADTLKAILMFDRNRGKSPNSKTLLQYTLTLSNDSKTKGLREAVELEMAILNERWEEDWEPEITDIDLLVDETVKEGRAMFWSQNLRFANVICTDGAETKKGKVAKGPDAALQYLAEKRTRDIQSEAKKAAGWLHENADYTQESLAKALDDIKDKRWKLGFSFIDNCLLIGVGANMNKFIGILGHSGDGKSTLLHSIVYNLIVQGATVLYNSTEHDPEELWEIMAFQAYEKHMDTLALPPRFVWDMARGGVKEFRNQLTQKHVDNMRVVTDGLKNRTLVPGAVDCQQFHSYEEILDHLMNNNRKWGYDVVVIDYLGTLDVGSDYKFEQAARKKLIADCQKLTRHFNSDRGIVVISPIQVNRAGKEAADNAEAEQRRYNRDAIREFSEYCHDMDFILSVYSSIDMRINRQIEIDMVKAPRKGKEPRRGFAFIDPRTDRVRESDPPPDLNGLEGIE
jgi:archaellum biogenesis ATPase FlaH